MSKKNGFDLWHIENQSILDEIKNIIEAGIEFQVDTKLAVVFSAIISDRLRKNYDVLNLLFKSEYGYSIRKYIILRRMEKVKELLVYTDETLSDIARIFGYKSLTKLSNQLKKYTGFSSTYYRSIRREKLAIIDRNMGENKKK